MASESERESESGDSYIGSFISLISKYEIRYEGILYHLNVHDSTIGLKNVRSYGTEGRKKDGSQVPPSDKVYEYILFRGSDIKDLQVKSSPPARTEEQVHSDPAIIQPHYAEVAVGCTSLAADGKTKKSLAESSRWQDTPAALTIRGYPAATAAASLHQSAAQTTMYQQGYSGTSVGTCHPSVMSNPLTMQQLIFAPDIQASPTLVPANSSSEFRTPLSSSSPSTSVNPKFPQSLSPVQYSTSFDVSSSSLSTQPSLPSHSTSLTANTLTMSSFPSTHLDLNVNETQIGLKTVSDSKPVLPVRSLPYTASSLLGSNLGPLLTPSPSLLPLDQSAHSGFHLLSSSQKDMGALVPLSSDSSSSIPTALTQVPLLPLPTSTQKTAQFTEEFDFMAMNEKFKKDEVWGYLGKAKQIDKAGEEEENGAGRCVEEKEVQITNRKPAYKKDDFFDTISCNSLMRGRGAIPGQNRFSERMRQDTETFGIQQRPNLGYGGYGAGRGENFRVSHNWGRGYGYGGRGRGGQIPF